MDVSPDNQNDQIKEALRDSTCVDGEMHCLICFKWWKEWKSYVSWRQSKLQRTDKELIKPGPIDNNTLLTKEGELLDDLEEDTDFYVLPKKAWDLLSSWYKLTITYFLFDINKIQKGTEEDQL